MPRNGSTVKKTYNLPEDLILLAKRHFKARTETEAVILALRQVAFMDEVDRAMRATSGKIPGFRSPFR